MAAGSVQSSRVSARHQYAQRTEGGGLLHKRHGRSLLPAPVPGPERNGPRELRERESLPHKASGGSARPFLNMSGSPPDPLPAP